ncbi:MAG: hypothetical protein HRU06_19775 [Oceanospirillaceae bacterium]|nr:hypothetical protein [Oceanospirillaceae bacterium]
MNIAFPAFFILILIIPGFIFQNSYEKVENTTIDKKTFDVSSSLAFFYALLIHALLISLLSLFTSININYEISLKLLTGSKSIPDADLSAIAANVPQIFWYFSSAYVFAFIAGKVFQKIIFTLNPYKSSRFSFDTPWYYELKGKLSGTQDAQLIKLSCLVDSKDSSFLYYGILEDFYLDSRGELNRIVLSNVQRRYIELDDADTLLNMMDSEQNTITSRSPRFYKIKGNRLILKYEDIRNINIEYLYITEEN